MGAPISWLSAVRCATARPGRAVAQVVLARGIEDGIEVGQRCLVISCDDCRPRPRAVEASVNDTLKGRLDLERHGGRTTGGIYARIAQRLLAMTVCIWHNWATDAPVRRSLIQYDH